MELSSSPIAVTRPPLGKSILRERREPSREVLCIALGHEWRIIPWRSMARDIQCAKFFPREYGRAEISRGPLLLTRVAFFTRAFRTSRVASTWSDANDGKLSGEKNASAHRAPDVHGPPCGVTYSLSVPARP